MTSPRRPPGVEDILRHTNAPATQHNPVIPTPASLPETETALMTLAEFLAYRDPKSKSHPSSAYDATLEDLNPSTIWLVGRSELRRGAFGKHAVDVYGAHGHQEVAPTDNLLFRVHDSGAIIGVLHEGVLYSSRHWRVPDWYASLRDAFVTLHPREVREVKYPSEYERLVNDPILRNRKEYPILLRRIFIDGLALEVRAEREPVIDELDTIVFMTGDGVVVAMGSNEWGATLTRVAREFRGRGLGRALVALWYELNPHSTSGGFTPAGRATAIAVWADRVREFAAKGWYSDMVRAGTITRARAAEILAGLTKTSARPRAATVPARATSAEPELLVMVDDGITFILYDARFLEEQDEQYIYGYGFLRDSVSHGAYFYRLDYDPKYKRLATAIGLQMVRTYGNDPVYVAGVPSDLIEWTDIPDVSYDEGYLRLDADILPLRKLAAYERRRRMSADPYRQIEHSLHEIADAKW